MKTVSVSVVIPCFRCKETIGRALESIFSQRVRPSEIILVDDASNDGTLEELHKLSEKYFGHLIIVQMKCNLGAASARNAGWAIAKQSYIAFLDSDDSWHPEKLCIQYEYMLRNPDVLLSGHQCILKHENSTMPVLPANWNATLISSNSLLFRNSFSTPTVMLKRDIPFRFQDGKRYAEDFFLWQQIALAGFKVARIEAPLAYVHKPIYGSGGLSSQLLNMEKGELENFIALYDAGFIRAPLFTLAVIFSIAKCIKRLLITKINSLCRLSIGFK